MASDKLYLPSVHRLRVRATSQETQAVTVLFMYMIVAAFPLLLDLVGRWQELEGMPKGAGGGAASELERKDSVYHKAESCRHRSSLSLSLSVCLSASVPALLHALLAKNLKTSDKV